MKRMGIEPLYRRPNATKPAPGARDLPLPAAQAGDHAAKPGPGRWMARGFVHLAAAIGRRSR